MPSLLDRITIHPAICHGKPTIRGLRYPVDVLLNLLADVPQLARVQSVELQPS